MDPRQERRSKNRKKKREERKKKVKINDEKQKWHERDIMVEWSTTKKEAKQCERGREGGQGLLEKRGNEDEGTLR